MHARAFALLTTAMFKLLFFLIKKINKVGDLNKLKSTMIIFFDFDVYYKKDLRYGLRTKASKLKLSAKVPSIGPFKNLEAKFLFIIYKKYLQSTGFDIRKKN